MSDAVLHSISIAEFEKTLGNTLVVKYPDFKLDEYDDQYLANCCLPDRAHLHDEDWTFLILPNAKNKKTLYGMGYFRNFRDATVRRGAVQKALLLLSTQPYFSVFKPLLQATIEKYYRETKDGKEAKADHIFKALYETVNYHLTQKILPINLWGESYAVNIPVLGEDQFEGASLVELVGRFNVDTMMLWYGILTGLRILFAGLPAHAVGNCCVAAPLLVAPLHGFTNYITPYVALTDIAPIQRKPYICGTTNLLFETKTEWYDMMGSFTTGSVHCTQSAGGIKLGGSAREFIKNVISGIQDNKGEQWVRQQFYNYTKQFLNSVEGDRMSKDHRKWLSNFAQSELYQRYKADLKNAKPNEEVQNPLETFHMLHKMMNDPESVNQLKKTKLLFDLTKTLEDLTTIGQVCDADGVSVISAGLTSNSSQVRKYSAMVLSNLALSVQGQIAILSESILPRVIELLKDEMPNVQSAACYCLYKISTLYIGAQALVACGVQNALAELVASEGENLNLKREAAAALLQIYRYNPTAPKPPGIVKSVVNQLQYQRDKLYTSTLLQLLDVWNEGLPPLAISDKIKTPLALLKKGDQLTDDDIEIRTEASNYLLSEIVREPVLLYEFVEGGGVERILENEDISADNIDNEKLNKLKRISYGLLAPVTDSTFGRRKVMRYRVVERAIDALERLKDPLCLFSIMRFLEVCCQHSDTTAAFIESNGLNAIIKFILTHFPESDTNLLCIPALGALRYLLLFNPSIRAEINSEDKLQSLRSSLSSKSEFKGSTRLHELTSSLFSILDSPN